MLVEEIFKKDIYRNINSVVQAGQLDEATIRNELEEYVMTEEGTYFLETFFKNYIAVYKNPSADIGVWISGFFGSGKSHFLKILSYILHNRIVQGKSPVQYFYEKTNNRYLLSMMEECSQYPTDAILFNIDSRTSSASSEKERIVEVFLRVFNRHLGYSDTLWVAEMERQLADDNKYDDFKFAISEITGNSWEQVRLKVLLRKRKIVQALVKIGYEESTAEAFFEVNRHTFEMTSERLSQLIADYCRERGNNYRLIFLVDEVGQYIGNNTSLMLNLQTVVEDLGNRSRGQAWVLVTSQEKLEATVSNLDSTKDFSKIQGRFATKINLSSANTDEVIKKRLLEKTEIASDTLVTIYDQEEQMIRNRLSFDHNTTQLRSGYRSAKEFVSIYPFVPYQVDLLQKIFTKIRNQGEGGAAVAHGERSLLKGFQEAILANAKESVSNMVTLAEFYPFIRDYLESNITSTIARAEDRARNNEILQQEDIPVLMTLYLIKGIDEIKATANNIATLSLETIHDERLPLELRIKESLNRLQQAMFIEQHADGTYSFLSDEEQEINREIRVEEVDHRIIKQKLSDLFFGKMYPKIRYDFKQDNISATFDFNKRFDSYSKGPMSHALTMQVFSGGITPTEAALQANSGVLVLSLEPESLAEAESALRFIEQVQTYIRRKRGPGTTQLQHRIFDAKQSEIDEYADKAELLLRKSCNEATICIQGQERSFKGNFDVRLDNALEMLVLSTYSRFHYIDTPISFRNSKQEWIQISEAGLENNLFGVNNQKAFDDMRHYVDELARLNDRKTLKDILGKYKNVPYGWQEQDTIGILLGLMNAGKVKLSYAGEPFTPNNPHFYDRIEKISERDRLVIIPIVAMDREVKQDIIILCREFFAIQETFDTYEDYHRTILPKVEEMFIEPMAKIRERRNQSLSSEYPYPGEKELARVTTETQRLLQNRDSEQFVRSFIQLEDEVDNWFSIIDKLQGFYFKNPIQKFDEAVSTLNEYKQDLVIIRNEEIREIESQIKQILIKESPYRDIPVLPTFVKKLRELLEEEMKKQKVAVLKQAEHAISKINSLHDKEVFIPYPEIITFIENQLSEAKLIYEGIQKGERVTSIRLLLQQILEDATNTEEKAYQMIPDVVIEKTPKHISENQIYNLFFSGLEKIESESDLEKAISQIKEEFKKELQHHYLVRQ
ncbi:BREX system P-loop protein BrxC [Neobacillus drentensis]|uniref:BREX system P-loop protein BrxC n=1 Tax=Neobacillus drentensis TaxID=220684 RepID=UPI003002B03B